MVAVLNDLIGKTIDKAYFKSDAVAFICGEEVVKYYVEGDCCSASWVEHATNYGGYGSPVLEIVEDAVREVSTEETQKYDVLQQYAYRIRTAKGDIAIEHRNDSNGYYGGSLHRTSDVDLAGMKEVE